LLYFFYINIDEKTFDFSKRVTFLLFLSAFSQVDAAAAATATSTHAAFESNFCLLLLL
jgi:hypothetical protein